MAFGTIGWNGLGVINSCESTTGWAEQGGGTFSANPDQYLQGLYSIGNQYANKNGYTYYSSGSPLNFTTTYAGQKLYMWVGISSTSAVETLANDGLSIIMGGAYNASRHWTIAGNDDDNGWSQGWRLFIIDPTTVGTVDDGTYNNTIIDTYGLWVDTVSSVRAESIFIDEFAVADGMICHSGSGTFDELITYCWGTLGTRVIGVLTENGRFNYALGKLTVGDSTNATADTTLTVTDKVIGFNSSEYYNGSAWVPSAGSTSLYNIVNLEKHPTHSTTLKSVNSSWYGNVNAWLTFSKDSGASFDFNGGNLEKIKALTLDSNDSVQNMNLNDVESFTINGATFNGNTISASSPFIATTTISDCIFKNANTNCIQVTNLNKVDGCTFVSDGTGHAVEVTGTLNTQTMNWNCFLDDGAGSEWTGTTGSPITTTSTGNEAILVNVASGQTLTISIASGASVPTVQNTGSGDVNIVAGQRTLTITVKDGATVPPVTFTDQSVNVRIEAAAGGPLTEGTEILKALTDVNGQVSDVRSWASDQPITGWARRASSEFGAHTAGSGVTYFKEALITGTISSSGDTNITALLLSDE